MFGTVGIAMRDKDGNMVELDTKTIITLGHFLSKREVESLEKKSNSLIQKHGDNIVSISFTKAAKSQSMVTDVLDYMMKNPYQVTPQVLNMMFMLRTAASQDIKNAKDFMKHNPL